MTLKKQIPNLITLLNLFCGCLAVVFAVNSKPEIAALFVILGIGFDFFDGMAARLLNVSSDLGLQLDSLADMVTSGVVPGLIMFDLMKKVFGTPFYVYPDTFDFQPVFDAFDISYLSLSAFLITLASAYRLAKFNIDTRQTTSFIGVPTPANTLFIISLPLILEYQGSVLLASIILNPWFLIAITLLSSFLLNAEIPLFALKFKTWGFKENKVRYIFLLLTLILIALLQFIAIPCVILLYVGLSLIFKEKN